MAKRSRKIIRVGVYGIGRGPSFADQAAAMEGVEVAAICDQREGAVQEFVKTHPRSYRLCRL